MNKTRLLLSFLFITLLFGFLFPTVVLAQKNDDFFRVDDSFVTRDPTIYAITSGITNNNFGAPVGSGLLIMFGAGVAYAAVRRKRISKKGTSLMLAIVLLLGLTQCKKRIEQIIPDPGTTYSINLNVDNDSRVNVVFASDHAKVEFQAGDKIHVAYGGKYAGTLTHNGTEFAGNITTTIDGEQRLYFYFVGNKPFRSNVTTASTSFSVDISDQTAGLPVISMGASNTPFNGSGSYSARLDNKCALVKFNTPDVDGLVRVYGLKNVISFDLSKAAETAQSNSMKGVSSWAASTDSIINLYKESNTVRWAILIPQEKKNVACKALGSIRTGGIEVPKTLPSDYYVDPGVNVVLTPAPDKAFSTSKNDTYIYFAKGNLQCKRKGDDWSQYEWSFKLNQYDIDYSEDYTVGDDYAGNVVVSHFGWGASGYNNSTADTLALNYIPNSTIGTYNHATLADSVNPYHYGPSWTTNPFVDHDAGVNIANTNFDWGVYNSADGASGLGIKDGDGTTDSPYSWRLFTTAEIVYILGPNKESDAKPGNNCRFSSTINGVENARFVKARLTDANNGSGTGLNGLIIFPDIYTHPANVTNPENINNLDSYFDSNLYTTTQWALMEAEGAVFLPAAGCHERKNNRSYIHDINRQCYYWTSTCQNYDPNKPSENPAAHAKNLRVAGVDAQSHNMVTNSRSYRARGSSVRLVRDVPTSK